MLRSLLALTLVSLASGLPTPIRLPNVLGGGCTGTAAPKKTLPACYNGKASVLGGAFSETVVVSITSYDYSKDTGLLDIHASGVSPETCKDLPFAKSGQDLKFDTSCLSGTAVTAQYCADQDSVLLHVSVPHMPIVAMPVTLASVACP